MIQLLQIINHMFNTGFSQSEIKEIFRRLDVGLYDLNEVLDDLGVELTDYQYETLEAKLSLYESALSVVQMKRGA